MALNAKTKILKYHLAALRIEKRKISKELLNDQNFLDLQNEENDQAFDQALNVMSQIVKKMKICE